MSDASPMRTTDDRFEVRPGRPGTGLGLYARKAVKKGDFVLEYTGKKIPTEIADESDSAYLFEIDDKWTIDGPVPDNLAGYVNHDCDPNIEADVIDGRVIYQAVKDIAPGDELTVDYGEEYFDEFIRPGGCKCSSCERGVPSPHAKPEPALVS